MSTLRLQIAADGSTVRIEDPDRCPFPLSLDTPEFRGETDAGPLTVSNALRWEASDDPAACAFHLAGDPEVTGLEFTGRVRADADELAIEARIRNLRGTAIHSGQQFFVLNTGAAPEFQDPAGERTFLYAETGWTPLAKLLDPIHTGKHTVRMGATYNQMTVMWKIMARLNPSGKTLLAMAFDKAFAFAGDHPDWPPGILAGCRWGAINALEHKTLIGKIYLINHSLGDLRQRYQRDFK